MAKIAPVPGGRIASNLSTPNIPRLDKVKVPVEYSSGSNCFDLDLFTRSFHSLDNSNKSVLHGSFKTGGSMITLKLNLNKEDTFKFCKSLKYFSLAESLGGVESLICHPATMTHASVDDKTKNLLGIDDALVRLSIGCEDTNDLISDILFALNKF